MGPRHAQEKTNAPAISRRPGVNTPRRFAFKQALDAGSKANALSRLKGYAIRDAQANGAPTPVQPRADDIPF